MRTTILVVLGFTLGASSSALAQQPSPPAPSERSNTVTVSAAGEYDRNGFWRFWFGEEWRDAWAGLIQVPVLDLGRYAGGLTPFKAGGNQSRTLRFHGADGRTYIFRSTNKNTHNSVGPDLEHTPVGDVIQDQTASMHPTGHLVVSELQKAAGLLYAPPTLVFISDDARLGEFRSDFANTVGQIEERPDEGAGVTFAGAKKIVGADKLLENLEESLEDRFDSRDYLSARLIDFMVGDPDRGGDQWRFAQIEASPRDVYRAIPRDRDYAFMKVDGVLMGIGARLYGKLTKFGDRHPKLRALLWMTRDFDRSHLVDLSWPEWQQVVTELQQSLRNEVIDNAVGQLPEAHLAASGARIKSGLRARRDNLALIARQYYDLVNQDADVFASDEDEVADIDRAADGSVTVKIWRAKEIGDVATNGNHAPVFERRFVPEETREIRVFLERGNDRAIVRGSAGNSIKVRVIGGEGDDVLIDSAGARTRFYDASGQNTVIGASLNTKPFVNAPPKRSLDDDENDEPEENPRQLSEERRGRFKDLQRLAGDYVGQKMSTGVPRNWGSSTQWNPALDYREGSGVIVGFGPTFTRYGFRHMPYDWQLDGRALVGTTSGEVGLAMTAERYFESSRWSLGVDALASQLEAGRFFGFGNDTEFIDRSESLVRRRELSLYPSLRYAPGTDSRFAFGPVVRYVRAEIPEGNPANPGEATLVESMKQIGGRAEFVLDKTNIGPARQSGFAINLGASAYPAALDVKSRFGEAHAEARVFVPLGWPTLALRAGGQRVKGAFPLYESAFIGGRHSLRGFSFNRFAGDASAFGSAELRAPIARMTLLTRGQLGVLGFTDAGRVWVNRESEGGWHTSQGAGLWFSSLGQSVSVTYAKGEQNRVYVRFGLPF